MEAELGQFEAFPLPNYRVNFQQSMPRQKDIFKPLLSHGRLHRSCYTTIEDQYLRLLSLIMLAWRCDIESEMFSSNHLCSKKPPLRSLQGIIEAQIFK